MDHQKGSAGTSVVTKDHAEDSEIRIHELLSSCVGCNVKHVPQDNSFAAPAFMDFLNGGVSLEDIPMESSVITTEAGSGTPWDEGIKDLLLDLTSFGSSFKFSVCIILSGHMSKYVPLTAELMSAKYCTGPYTVVSVIPESEECASFEVTALSASMPAVRFSVSSDKLIASVIMWYSRGETAVLCHDYSIQVYESLISMMPVCRWSIQCMPTRHIQSAPGVDTCRYICPAFSYRASMETRAVGHGPVVTTSKGVPYGYSGRLAYFHKHIRGSKHTSGRCYDCQVLYRVLMEVYEPALDSPVKFTVTFTQRYMSLDAY